MGTYFDLLYARPSFLTGIASLIDFAGTLQQYNESESPEEADQLAILADVRAIRQDIDRVRAKIAADNGAEA